jgi:hypothetical protein
MIFVIGDLIHKARHFVRMFLLKTRDLGCVSFIKFRELLLNFGYLRLKFLLAPF